MRDVDLYAQIPGLPVPWEVTAVDLDRAAGELVIKVALAEGSQLSCPHCGQARPGYDHRLRRLAASDSSRSCATARHGPSSRAKEFIMREKNIPAGLAAISFAIVGGLYIAKALFLAIENGFSPGRLGAIHHAGTVQYAGFVIGCGIGIALMIGLVHLGCRWIGIGSLSE